MSRVIVMLPTYNEAENIEPLLDALLALEPRVEILVVDDDSPDKTWLLVQRRAAEEPRLHLLYRKTDRGRGKAGVAGMRKALELGADAVIEMDADWSHDPRYIPRMIAAAERTGAAIVIGSRRVDGGGEAGRHPLRAIITWAANAYIRLLLEFPVRDTTTGYRYYTRACLEAMPWEAIRAEGPEILQELMLAADARGFRMVEIPIRFVDRRAGRSNFNLRIMLRSLGSIVRLWLRPGALVPEGSDLARRRRQRRRRRLRAAGRGVRRFAGRLAAAVRPAAGSRAAGAGAGPRDSSPPAPAATVPIRPLAFPWPRRRKAQDELIRVDARVLQRRRLIDAPRLRAGLDTLEPAARWLARPAGYLYGLGRSVHRAARIWRPGGRKALPVPVICVGNLTVGGTGKTPFVRLMAETLSAMGRRPAIVSRGYGARVHLNGPVVVSDGTRVYSTPSEAGDEPRLLAEQCSGVPVIIHPDRAAAGRLAIQQFDPDVILLDDGFQHDRLARDLDLVLWDLRDDPDRTPLLPAGRLRERPGALRRADAIILTHAEYLAPEEREGRRQQTVAALKRHAPAVPIFEAETVVAGFRRLSGRVGPHAEPPAEADGPWPWTGRPVILVSALARPQGLESLARQTGGRVVRHFAYFDHHEYGPADVDAWRRLRDEEQQAGREAPLILTTAKDGVKLQHLPMFGLPVIVVEIEMRVLDAPRWNAFLHARLNPH